APPPPPAAASSRASPGRRTTRACRPHASLRLCWCTKTRAAIGPATTNPSTITTRTGAPMKDAGAASTAGMTPGHREVDERGPGEDDRSGVAHLPRPPGPLVL